MLPDARNFDINGSEMNEVHCANYIIHNHIHYANRNSPEDFDDAPQDNDFVAEETMDEFKFDYRHGSAVAPASLKGTPQGHYFVTEETMDKFKFDHRSATHASLKQTLQGRCFMTEETMDKFNHSGRSEAHRGLNDPPQDDDCEDEDDVVIAVIGATGSGKSSFVEHFTRDNSAVTGHSFEPDTSDIQVIRFSDPVSGRNVTILDTPGFGDSRESITETEILKEITKFLLNVYGRDRKLDGLIYIQRISDPRFSGQSARNLKMFSNLCREGKFKHVVVLTTFWDDVTNEAGTKRERRLKSKFFQELVQGGARFMRHNGSSGSAQKVLKHILTLRNIEENPQDDESEDDDTPQDGDFEDEDEVLIAVIGATGSGKSSFVRLLTRDNSIAIGNGFEPETSAIEAVPFFDPVSGRNMTILDTPGFGDSRESITESEILERINKFLLNEYDRDRKLDGLIYIQRISDPRFSGQSTRNLRMFCNLCGEGQFRHVVVLTTFWDDVTNEEGTKRERRLKSKFFKELVQGGARFMRHNGSPGSAEKVRNHVLTLSPTNISQPQSKHNRDTPQDDDSEDDDGDDSMQEDDIEDEVMIAITNIRLDSRRKL